MSVKGKRRFRSVRGCDRDEAAYSADHRRTIRSDAAAILESLLAEFGEQEIVEAMNKQGFEGRAYQSTIRDLRSLAFERRLERKA